ncbi:MAG TPA: hypothetical protein VFA74_01395 [Terriglobales bacterium]|nr:hypothetical protein [Terriglobales bacterium]
MTLDQHIRELCAQATAAEKPEEVKSILARLRAALRQHTANIKMLLARYPVPSDHLVDGSTPLVSTHELSTHEHRADVEDSTSDEVAAAQVAGNGNFKKAS